MKRTKILVMLWALFCIGFILFCILYVVIKNSVEMSAEAETLALKLLLKWRSTP